MRLKTGKRRKRMTDEEKEEELHLKQFDHIKVLKLTNFAEGKTVTRAALSELIDSL